jgi:hypothetical protein
LPTDPETVRAPRARRPQQPTSRFRRLPWTIRFVIPVMLLLFLGREGWRELQTWRGHIQVVDAEGMPLALVGRVEVFAADESPSAPSPTPQLGVYETEADGSLTLAADEIGERALVRMAVSGHGIGYGIIEPGAEVLPLRLGQPMSVAGRVIDTAGVPVPGAQIQVLGGGARGVLLTEVETDPNGEFTVGGVSDTVRSWSFRVFARGYELGQVDWLSRDGERIEFTLNPAPPAGGRLVLDGTAADRAAPALGDLELRIHHLPGVTARTQEDGTFSVHHLPPAPRFAHVLVPGLPSGWTYRRTALRSGDTRDVLLQPAQQLRGRVVNGHTNGGVAGAVVYHEHGPNGIESAVCDGDGRFVLDRVPFGPVEVFADVMVPRRSVPADKLEGKGRGRKVLIQGTESVFVQPGQTPEPLKITMW